LWNYDFVTRQNKFTCANVGANTVTLRVTDINGNVATKTAIVTVEDKIAAVVLTKHHSSA
jgi:expansin (peptidoglycan-binding protein)